MCLKVLVQSAYSSVSGRPRRRDGSIDTKSIAPEKLGMYVFWDLWEVCDISQRNEETTCPLFAHSLKYTEAFRTAVFLFWQCLVAVMSAITDSRATE